MRRGVEMDESVFDIADPDQPYSECVSDPACGPE
jgi:hypothetical protein